MLVIDETELRARLKEVLRRHEWKHGYVEGKHDLIDAIIRDSGTTGLCEGCGVNRSDPPSPLCVGCQAYRDHQA